MPKIRMPDGIVVAFPDDMPKEEIQGIIAKKFPNEVSAPASDLEYGLAHGARAVAGGIGDAVGIINEPRNLLVGAIGQAGDMIRGGDQFSRAVNLMKAPSVGDMVQTKVDEATGGLSKPENPIQEGADTFGRVATGLVSSLYSPKAGQEAAAGAGKIASAVKNTARAALPSVDEGLKPVAELAIKHNIPISFDEISASRPLKTAQKISQDIPFAGQAGFRDKQLRAFNQGVLKTVGEAGDRIDADVMNKAFTRVGKGLDDFGSGKTFNLNNGFNQKIAEIEGDAAITATNDARDNFKNLVNYIRENADTNGAISGEKLGELRVRVNALSRKANSADTQELLHDTENAIIETMTSGDPKLAEQLNTLKKQYKNLLVIEPLAVKGKGGNISPSLLNQRVARIYGRGFTKGEAGDIGELAKVGHELLPELGGSDTFQKGFLTGGAVTSLLNPVAASLTGAGIALNRAAQSGLNRNQALIRKAVGVTESTEKPTLKTIIKGKK